MPTRTRNAAGYLIAMKQTILDQCLNREIKDKEVAKLLGIHPKSFSRIKHRYKKEGLNALCPRKPGPKKFSPTNKTSERVENLAITMAANYPELGPLPLAEKLLEIHGIKLDQSTIWRILKRRQARYTLNYRRWKDNPQLYCLDKPGLELQLDAHYPFGRAKQIAVFDAIDDCSRYGYGKVFKRETVHNAKLFVKELVNRMPFTIQKIRVDNRFKGQLFRDYCNRLGIEVIVNDPYSPEQNGKIERFHKTVKRECFWKYCSFHDPKPVLEYQLAQFYQRYNYRRKHSGFGMNRMTPAQKIATTLFQSLHFIHYPQINYPQKVTSSLQQYRIWPVLLNLPAKLPILTCPHEVAYLFG